MNACIRERSFLSSSRNRINHICPERIVHWIGMPDNAEPVLIAKGVQTVSMLPGMANRHGLIAGATGTGKTTTLRVHAENFCRIGVPVFMADIRGDLS